MTENAVELASNWVNLPSRTLRKTSDVASSYACQASHSDIFPFPWKDDVVSQLVVMAWNSGSAFAFLGPNASQKVPIDIYWKCFPMSKAT